MEKVKQGRYGKTRSEILLYIIHKRKASRADIKKHFKLSDPVIGEHLDKLIRKELIFRGNHGIYYIKEGFDALKNTFNELVKEGRHLQAGKTGFEYEYVRILMQTQHFKTYIKTEEFKEKLFLSVIKGFVVAVPQILSGETVSLKMEKEFNRVAADMRRTKIDVLPVNDDVKNVFKKVQAKFDSGMKRLEKFGEFNDMPIKNPDESDEDYTMRMEATSYIKKEIASGSTPESTLFTLLSTSVPKILETKQAKDFLDSDIDKIYKDITENPNKKSRMSKANLSRLSKIIIRKREESAIYTALMSSPSALDFVMNIDKGGSTFFAGLLEYYLTPFFCSIPKTLETLNKLPRLNKRMGQSKFLELIVRMTASTPSKTPLYNALTSHFVLDANGGELLMTKDAKSVLKRRSLPSIRNPEEI
jgi:hypothetical protein